MQGRARTFRAFLTAVLGVVAGVAGGIVAASPAHAAGVDALCSLGSGTYTFSPGLTLVQRPTSYTASGAGPATCFVAPNGVTNVTQTSDSGSGNQLHPQHRSVRHGRLHLV